MRENANLRFTKAKFIMKINEVEKYTEDEKTKLRVINSRLEYCRGADLERSLREDYNNRIERKIEYVDKEPDTFVLGTLYVRKDGKMVYVFNEKAN